jgi:N-acetylmuramoyl-L-alanine amidase
MRRNTVAKIKRIVVHCSDSPDSLDIGVKEIREWHTSPPPNGRGWRDVGYHKVIRRGGKIESGRFENGDSILEGAEIGAHAVGHNAASLAVCLVGRLRFDRRQIAALLTLLAELCRKHDVAVSDVVGHYELDSRKTCPNLDLDDIRDALEGHLDRLLA